jgi:hypothetical protein
MRESSRLLLPVGCHFLPIRSGPIGFLRRRAPFRMLHNDRRRDGAAAIRVPDVGGCSNDAAPEEASST